MKYAVVTFGCRVNQADSLEIEGELRALGAVGAAPSEADLVVVNTCSVTAAADQGARQTIRRVARDNPAARIVVTGCYATRAPADLRRCPRWRTSCRTSARTISCAICALLGADHRRAFCRRRRTLRQSARTRCRRAHRADTARADRLRRALQLLHHSEHPRPRPLEAAGRRSRRDRACGRGWLSRGGDHRRSSRILRPRSRRRHLAAVARPRAGGVAAPTCCSD